MATPLVSLKIGNFPHLNALFLAHFVITLAEIFVVRV